MERHFWLNRLLQKVFILFICLSWESIRAEIPVPSTRTHCTSCQSRKTPFAVYGKERIEACKRKADVGDPESQYLYAQAVLTTMLPVNAKSIAVKYASSAAEQGYGPAYFIMGYSFRTNGTEVNEWVAKAVNWASKHAKQGDPVAQWQFSRLAEIGLGIPRDENFSVSLRDKAAANGLASAQKSQASSLFRESEQECEANKAKSLAQRAVVLMTKAADAGDPSAQWWLATWYGDGMVGCGKESLIPIDKQKSFNYLKKSADQGYELSYTQLANAYKDGVGCLKDKAAYVEWMCKAADVGDVNAQYTVGIWREMGNYVGKDEAKAIELIRGCASHQVRYEGSVREVRANAAAKLSKWYETGFGEIEKDEQLSIEWLEKAVQLDIDGHISKLIEKEPMKAAMVCKRYKGLKGPGGRYYFTKNDDWRSKRIAECVERSRQSDELVANKKPILTETLVEELKNIARQHKCETFVFKGFYLGMDAVTAMRLMRYYFGIISNEVEKTGAKVNKITLSRKQIDVLFKTEGVSTESFCKSICSAYPIVSDFDMKLETIADYAARKKFMKEAEEDAMSNVRMTNPADIYFQGVAAGREARRVADKINKRAKCYFCESPKGFLLEIRPEEPERFFTLQKISSLKKENFD